jgi:hypothetical protein
MAAQIYFAQDVVPAASAAGNASIVAEEIEQPFVVECCARHADRRMHANWQRVTLGILAVSTNNGGRKPVTFIQRGCPGSYIGLSAEANTLHPIGVLEARQAKRVFQRWRLGALGNDYQTSIGLVGMTVTLVFPDFSSFRKAARRV